MADTFQLSEMLLELTEKSPYPVLQVEVDRLEEEKTVEIRDILDEDGKRKTVRCSDVRIRVVKEEDHGI